MSPLTSPLRGQVFQVNSAEDGPHFWLVVSNNRRNLHLVDVLTVMLTTTPPTSPRASYVPLAKGLDPFEGWVKCDDIGPHYRDELGPVRGALSPATMRKVDEGLAFALSLPRGG
jgi:mRNA interferase MazF